MTAETVGRAFKRGRKWTLEEVQALRRLAADGHRASVIARLMDRTEAAVRGKSLCCGIDLVSDRKPQPITLRTIGAPWSQVV